MSTYKILCKCCGGENDVPSGAACGQCFYCGMMQTFPIVQDEAGIEFINTAIRYRIESQYEKATEIYNKLLETEADSDLYWGRLLSRYGIRFYKRANMMEATATCDLPVPILVPDAQVGKDGMIMHDSDYIHAKRTNRPGTFLYVIDLMKIGRAQKRALGIPCAFPEEPIHKEPTENE